MLFTLFAMCVLFSPETDGAAVWTGNGADMLWCTPENWQDDAAPVEGDDVTVDGGGSDSPVIISADEPGTALGQLTIGSESGTAGFVRMDAGSSLMFKSGVIIGRAGDGTFVLNGGNIASSGGSRSYVALSPSSNGQMDIISGYFAMSNDLTIAESGTGKYVQTGGQLTFGGNGGERRIKAAVNASSYAYIDISGGTLNSYGPAFYLYLAVSGAADLRISGSGSLQLSRSFYAAQEEGSKCTINVWEGGKLAVSRESYIGVRGTAYMDVASDVTMSRGFFLGQYETGKGILRIGPVAITCNNGDSQSISATTIGKNGHGELHMSGTEFSFAKKGFTIRESENAFGLIRGYGTINTSGKDGDAPNRKITNNGIVIADGCGSENDLVFGSGFKSVTNTLENVSTNGWYAYSGGRLVLPGITVPEGVYSANWGEDMYDDDIDLINSAKITFSEDSAGGSLSGSLLSNDRTDIPDGLLADSCAGIWEFECSSTLFPSRVEFKLDPIQTKGKTVLLKQYNPASSSWEDADSVITDDGRISTQVSSLGFFAVTASEYTTFLFIK